MNEEYIPSHRVNQGYNRQMGVYRIRLIIGVKAVGEPVYTGSLAKVMKISAAWLKKNHPEVAAKKPAKALPAKSK